MKILAQNVLQINYIVLLSRCYVTHRLSYKVTAGATSFVIGNFPCVCNKNIYENNRDPDAIGIRWNNCDKFTAYKLK